MLAFCFLQGKNLQRISSMWIAKILLVILYNIKNSITI